MASRDLVNKVATVQLLAPANQAASPLTSFTSNILNTQGFESAVLLVNIGSLVGVNGTNYLTLTMQECATTVGAQFTNVSQQQNLIAGQPSPSADFGDQDRPWGSQYPTAVLPPANGPNVLPTPPTFYTGFQVINTTTLANSHFRVGYIGNLQYIRLIGTWTGAPTTAQLDVIGFLGHSWFDPVVSPAAIVAM
jgi:hypothetical protein